jgi:hypothetical protein
MSDCCRRKHSCGKNVNLNWEEKYDEIPILLKEVFLNVMAGGTSRYRYVLKN